MTGRGCLTHAPVMSDPLSPDQIRAIGDQLRNGNKILAVKLFREAAGCSLLEAKNAIEAMDDRYSGAVEATPSRTPTPTRTGLTPEVRSAVLTALRKGNKIEAIKIYREATGLGLAESKDAVEAMEGESDQAPRLVPEGRTPLPAFDPFEEKKKSGCFGVLMLVIGALVYLASR